MTPSTMNAEPLTGRDAALLSRLLPGIQLILGAMLIRCLSPFDPFPYWSGDPFEAPSPVAGLTPMTSIILDWAVAIGAAIACSGMTARELRRGAVCIATCALAVIPLLHHTHGAQGLDNFVYGSALISAFVSASVVFAVGGRPQIRRLTIGALLGLLTALAVRSIHQVYVEHPQTVADFRLTRDQFFRSQGWTPDSPMAKAFERRLHQPEASGFFGLSNPLATLGAAGLALSLAIFWGTAARRDVRSSAPTPARGWSVTAMAVCVAGCALIVYLSGAKGGFAAAALGVGVVLVGVLATQRGWAAPPRVRRLIGPLVVLAALGAVAARGFVGDRIGELSILFRWFYMQAAGSIFAEHPVWGVGTMGFKDAYLLAKNPMSPEEVTSAHSVLFDLVCGFGVGGVLLALLLMVWTSLAGAGVFLLSAPEAAPHQTQSHISTKEGRSAAVLILIAIIVAIALERAVATPDMALMRLVAAGVAAWVVAGVCRTLQGVPAGHWVLRVGLGAAAIAAIAHCQIELTMTTLGAGAWCLVLIACGAAGGNGDSTLAPTPKRAAVALAVLVVFVGATLQPAIAVVNWQRSLAEAYRGGATHGGLEAEHLAELTARRNALATGTRLPGFDSDTPAALARDLSAIFGAGVEPTPDSIDTGLASMRQTCANQALAAMPAMNKQTRLAHAGTARARSRLYLILAESKSGPSAEMSKECHSTLNAGWNELTENPHPSLTTTANSWAWAGVYAQSAAAIEERFAVTGSAENVAAWRAKALLAWTNAHQRGPFELLPARRSLEVSEILGDRQSVRSWAAECLRISDLLRLDPIEQLPADEVARLKVLAEGP